MLCAGPHGALRAADERVASRSRELWSNRPLFGESRRDCLIYKQPPDTAVMAPLAHSSVFPPTAACSVRIRFIWSGRSTPAPCWMRRRAAAADPGARPRSCDWTSCSRRLDGVPVHGQPLERRAAPLLGATERAGDLARPARDATTLPLIRRPSRPASRYWGFAAASRR